MPQADAQRIADTIVAGQWRHDRATRWAAAIAVIMLLLLMIPIVSALASTGTQRRPFAGSSTDQAQVYARLLGGSRGTQRVYVSDRFCDGLTDVGSGGRGLCFAGPISPQLQRQIRVITGTQVVFTSRPPQPGPNVVLHIGTALIMGNHAEVAYDLNCGQLCGNGETAIFTKLAGTWARTGTGAGYQWIS